MYKIYSLNDPLTNEIRYIGYTKGSLKKRLKEHIYDSNRNKSHKCNWIRKLRSVGLNPVIFFNLLLQQFRRSRRKRNLLYIKIQKSNKLYFRRGDK